MKVKGIGETQLQPHQSRQDQCHQADEDRRTAVLDCDDLVVLAPDILGDERLRVVHFIDLVSDCHVLHAVILVHYRYPMRRIDA